MKKSKKGKPRPCFRCETCGALWVTGEKKYTDCLRCKMPGKPLNEGAEKLLRKKADDENL